MKWWQLSLAELLGLVIAAIAIAWAIGPAIRHNQPHQNVQEAFSLPNP
jgi:hypothetical protein